MSEDVVRDSKWVKTMKKFNLSDKKLDRYICLVYLACPFPDKILNNNIINHAFRHCT